MRLLETLNNKEIQALEAPASEAVLARAETVHRQFAAYAADKPYAQCILMLDPALRDATNEAVFYERLQQFRQSAERGDNFPPILWKHPNLTPEHRPYLIGLDLRRFPDAQLFEASLKLALADWTIESLAQAVGHRVCGWLFTEHTVNALAVHLGRLAVQRLPHDFPTDAGKRILLRYFDPSVMPALWQLSDASQQRALLGPVAKWIVLDRTGQLQPYQARPPADSEGEPDDHPSQPRYSATQWLALQNIGPLNQAIVQWQLNAAGGLPPPLPQIVAAAHSLARARRYGIHDAQDLKAFASHALTVHADFDKHPRVRQALQRLSQEQFYTAAIADITEQDWQNIRSGRDAADGIQA
jgi:hypothetical protein